MGAIYEGWLKISCDNFTSAVENWFTDTIQALKHGRKKCVDRYENSIERWIW